MHLSRNGFDTDDFYNTNDTDHVHFRWLHKVMKRVPRLSFSNLDSKTKYYQSLDHQVKRSPYGANTYQATISGEDSAGESVTSPVNPYIDDQLDSYYQQVIKPQLDQAINELNNEIKQTNAKVTANSDSINNLTNEMSSVNAAIDKIKKG